MSRLKLTLAAAVVLPVLAAIVATQLSPGVGTVVALAIAALVVLLLVRYVAAPLAEVADAARALASGNHGARAGKPRGATAELVAAFNRMAHEIEEQLGAASQERNRLTATLNSSINAVLALDRGGKVLFANLAAQELLSPGGSGIIGNQIAWLLPDEAVVDAVRASRERPTPAVNRIERPGHRYFHVVTTPIVGGGEWAVLLVIQDVTEVHRTDQMRRDFVANVSHELRTPLAGIKAVIETLAEGNIDDPAIRQDFLTRADDEVDRLIQLVEELLELSRIESGDLPFNFQETNLRLLVEDVVGRMLPQAERKRIQIVNEVAEPFGSVSLDRVRMERALLNLVHNAIKFTPSEGRVTLSAERAADHVRIAIRDTGPGIDPEDLPRVFERFFKADASRTSGGGSGIGLAIVKHTVEAHDGRVRVESRLGQGATFTIELPATRERAASPEQGTGNPKPA